MAPRSGTRQPPIRHPQDVKTVNENDVERGIAYALQFVPIIGIIVEFLGSTNKKVALPLQGNFTDTGIMEWSNVVNKAYTMVDFTRAQVRKGLIAGLAAISAVPSADISPQALFALPLKAKSDAELSNMLDMGYWPTRGKYAHQRQNLFLKGCALVRQLNRNQAAKDNLQAVIDAGQAFVADGVFETVDGESRLKMFESHGKAINGWCKSTYGADWWKDKVSKARYKIEAYPHVRPLNS